MCCDAPQALQGGNSINVASAQLRQFIAESPVCVAMFDRRMCYLAVSQRWLEEYGRGYPSLIGLCHYDVHPDVPEYWKDAHKRALAGEVLRNDADHWVQDDGSDHWLRWGIHPWRDIAGEIGGVIISAEDVTQRVLAENAARFHQDLLKETGHIAKVGGWEFDVASGKGCWTEEVALIHDLPREAQPNKDTGLSFYLPESRARIERALEQTIHQGIPYDLELEILTAKGNRRWVRSISHPVYENGVVVKVRGSYQDITERKLAEDTLRRQASLLDLAFGAVFVWEHGGGITFWSRGAEVMYGFSREEAIGRNVHELLRSSAQQGLSAILQALAQSTKWEGELEHFARDGKRIFVESRMVQITQDSRTLILETAQDVTGKRALEEKLRQSQKMEAIGRLAGGVAHDFNNLLGIILGSAELISESNCLDRIRWRAQEIINASERGASLTRQLLAFSRKQIVEPKIMDLNTKLEDLMNMLSRLMGENFELSVSLCSALPPIRIDPSQLEQIVLNLVVNARDAMPDGGKISIETRIQRLTESDRLANLLLPPGDYVTLVVADSGVGMDAESQSHIFEPFFTTKEGGTGLGLATVYGALRNAGGGISLVSEPGKGSSFTAYFPSSVEPLSPAEAKNKQHSRASGTILIVEDSDSLREVTKEFLELTGYAVLEAGDADNALSLARRFTQPIHLLLTDVIMPGMSGPDLAKSFLALHPESRVLFMSGYTENHIAHHGLLNKEVRLLTKPFSRDALTRNVHEILNS